MLCVCLFQTGQGTDQGQASMYFGHSLFDPQSGGGGAGGGTDLSEGVMEPSAREEALEVSVVLMEYGISTY